MMVANCELPAVEHPVYLLRQPPRRYSVCGSGHIQRIEVAFTLVDRSSKSDTEGTGATMDSVMGQPFVYLPDRRHWKDE